MKQVELNIDQLTSLLEISKDVTNLELELKEKFLKDCPAIVDPDLDSDKNYELSNESNSE